MVNAWHLGDQGEENAADLLSAFELGEGLQVVFLLAADARVLAEVRERLSCIASVCREIEPSGGIDGLLEEAGRGPGRSDRRPLLWLQSKKFDVELWRLSLANYAFTERFLGVARGWREERPWRTDVREIDGLPVGVLQLNSAWASGSDGDRGNLLVGDVQVREALEEISDAFVKVALLHHPLTDLRDCDHGVADVLQAKGGADFVLRGHLHRSRPELVLSPDRQVAHLACGAVYVRETEYPKACMAVEADLGDREARVHLFRYSPEGRGFWAPDSMAFEEAQKGVWSFPLPPSLQLDRRDPDATEGAGEDPGRRGPEEKSPPSINLAARYRAACSAVFGSARFIGLADHSPRPSVRIPDLFVPLHFKAHGRVPESDDGDDRISLSDLVQGLLRGSPGATKLGAGWESGACLAGDEHGAPARKPSPGGFAEDGVSPRSRFVILGDPGSGKSTLCRYLAILLTGELRLDGVEVSESAVPLLVPFREYVIRRRDDAGLGLIEFLREQARVTLSLRLPAGFFEGLLASGNGMLLLDGLDEVGLPEDRAAVRDEVEGLCQTYPKAQVLVTSRIAGYDDAPLVANRASGGVVTCRLDPFDDRELEDFVNRWYQVQESDVEERDRGVAGLIGAFQAEPRVRELARNPLLATLIGLIHRLEARLPGERAKLYELCIKTLIETWPASRRREFRELDAGLQRVYLEYLAFEMQAERSERRQGDGSEILISRSDLTARLVAIMRRRDRSGEDEAATRGLAERWVRHLEQETGVLVEQRTGYFGFYHLSFLEYLAARGLERQAGTRWKDLLADPPPSDWLPRAHWHLCWLLHDQAEPVHRRGLKAAMAEGVANIERACLAKAMRERLEPLGLLDIDTP